MFFEFYDFQKISDVFQIFFEIFIGDFFEICWTNFDFFKILRFFQKFIFFQNILINFLDFVNFNFWNLRFSKII